MPQKKERQNKVDVVKDFIDICGVELRKAIWSITNLQGYDTTSC